ncbi:hypothetical protein EGR_09515 [Echinococcus granulosus]|uniref:Uncharacterized protein n=1 Tax=Echinococcus granulosus TaxID=6210 RepID=W6U3D1_ECHGR|nr:hypothetical protein EGR_09515 [Echinococcus granulosus]EUB55620.1 hypothetical protein EGR_09515 [Echinococcus granulosus]
MTRLPKTRHQTPPTKMAANGGVRERMQQDENSVCSGRPSSFLAVKTSGDLTTTDDQPTIRLIPVGS